MSAQIFGLDIGRAFIKVVQVKVGANKVSLEVAASVATPPDGLKAEAKPQLKLLSETVKTLVKNSKISGNKCAVSIVESQAVTRLTEFPNLTDKELAAAIQYEADQYIPLPLADVNLQYKVVSRPEPGSQSKMDVLLIAAPKRVVAKYVDVVREAGLVLYAIETESAALSRALFLQSDVPCLIVSVGAESTDLIIVKRGSVFFTRSVSTGGFALTRAIMAEFKLSQNQAEEYKMAYGILEDKLSGKIAAVLKPILEVITSEVLKASEYAKSRLQGDVITRIVVCGGGSYLPGLAEFITQRTSLEVSLADPWAKFDKDGLLLKMPGQGSFYSVATGLALRT